MDNQTRIAGGIFVSILMIFLAVPFNDEIQGLALATGATGAIRTFAIIFPYFWIGLIFIILAFTGYDVIENIS